MNSAGGVSGCKTQGAGGDRTPTGGAGVFATTQWSVVLCAAGSDTTRAQAALQRLCQTYWYSLYAYVRRRGHAPADAQDLTQAFFARLLERRWLELADRSRGRFRTFMLTALSRFLSDEWDKGRAQKRGGQFQHLSLQYDNAESRYSNEPVDHLTPEHYFERRWALTLLDTVMERLRAEYGTAGKGSWFAQLAPTLLGNRESQPYAELAAQLGTNENAVKVAVHRLRKRYRELLRQEIVDTIGNPAEVEDELRHIFSVLTG